MPRFTFRFGELNKAGTDERPEIDLDSVLGFIEEEGIVGDEGDRKWARNPIRGENSLYFEFIKEIPEEFQTFSEEDRIVTEEVGRIRAMHFLLFEDGFYGFESRKGIHDGDVLKYVFEDYSERYDSYRFESLDLSKMRDFYKKSYEVRKFKAENIGERAPNPRITDEELKEITEDTGLRTHSIIASVGRAYENLQDVSLFDDGIAKYSDLPMIKSRDAGGNIRKLRDSGRFDFGVSTDDESEEAQAAEIRDTVRSVMRELFDVSLAGDNSEDSEDDDATEDAEEN